MDISLYDGRGRPFHKVTGRDDFERVPNSRLAREVDGETYLKGAGCSYFGHYVLKPDPETRDIEKVPIDYLGYRVMDPAFVGKTGIFFARFQPPFSDPIGGCGVKETRIYEHSKEFGRSGVEVVGVMPVLANAPNVIYRLKYKGGRTKMEDGQIKTAVLADLLVYMLEADWNFPWDKNVLGDINQKGLVTDVADLFHSTDMAHKFGTVYSFMFGLHCLGRLGGFCKCLGLKRAAGLYEIPFRVAKLLEKRCNADFAIDCKESTASYLRFMKELLINGKSCASLESHEFDEFAKRMYLRKLRALEVTHDR